MAIIEPVKQDPANPALKKKNAAGLRFLALDYRPAHHRAAHYRPHQLHLAGRARKPGFHPKRAEKKRCDA